jgi:ADP-ribose pyrophosphatase
MGWSSFLAMERLHLAGPGGDAIVRVVVRHPGAVGIVALDGADVVLLRQYRAPLDREILEIPAGKLDVVGEDQAAAAERELAEEVGLAGRLQHLVTIDTTPGFCDERIVIFLATELRSVPSAPHGAEERQATVVRMGLAAAIEAVMAGSITDAKTIAGLFAAAHRR